MTDPQAASSTPKSSQPAWMGLALGFTTAPLLLGLVLADRAGKWLGSLTWEDPGWWLGDRLPNLDSTTLRARQQQNKNSPPGENP